MDYEAYLVKWQKEYGSSCGGRLLEQIGKQHLGERLAFDPDAASSWTG
jgi:hypothetical protein